MTAWKLSSNATPCHCNFPFSRVVLGVRCARNISIAKFRNWSYVIMGYYRDQGVSTNGRQILIFLSQYLTFHHKISSIWKCAYIRLVFSIIYQLLVAQGKFEEKKAKAWYLNRQKFGASVSGTVTSSVTTVTEVKSPSTHWPVCRAPVFLVFWLVLAAPIVELPLNWTGRRRVARRDTSKENLTWTMWTVNSSATVLEDDWAVEASRVVGVRYLKSSVRTMSYLVDTHFVMTVFFHWNEKGWPTTPSQYPWERINDFIWLESCVKRSREMNAFCKNWGTGIDGDLPGSNLNRKWYVTYCYCEIWTCL